jgi:hypothetical protein
MIKKGCFLLYPCGKLFEIRIPITILENDIQLTILPTDDNYFQYAKNKFEINNLKVIEKEMYVQSQPIKGFISLVKKIKCIK